MPYSEIRVSSAGYSPPDRLLKSLNLSQLFKHFAVTSELPLLEGAPASEGAFCFHGATLPTLCWASRVSVEKAEGLPR